MPTIVDHYRDRKVVVIDRVGVLTRVDDGELNPMALEPFKLLKEQNYSIVIWSQDSNRAVKETTEKIKSALEQDFLEDVLIIGGENYSMGYPKSKVNKEDFLSTLYFATNQGRITQSECQEIEAIERMYDFLDYTKPHFLFFPEGTPLIDDDGLTFMKNITGSPAREEFKDLYPPHGRVGGYLHATGLGLLERYPIIAVESVYSWAILKKRKKKSSPSNCFKK